MLENQNQIFGSKLNQGLNPRLKVLLGGFLLIGIFAGIFSMSGQEKISANLLSSEVLNTVPEIQSVSPTSGEIGSSVYITGKNFSDVPTQNLVKFGDQTATVKTVGYAGENIMRIIAIVPNLPMNKSYEITVKNQAGTAISDAQFEVLKSTAPIPSITRFEPTSGYAGDKIYIYGDNFATQAVDNIIELETESGKSVRASRAEIVHVNGSTALKFTIPDGAITGKIYLTVGGIKSESVTNLEVLTEAPVIENTPITTSETTANTPTEAVSDEASVATDTPTSIDQPAEIPAVETPTALENLPAAEKTYTGNIPQNLRIEADATGWRLSWEKPQVDASYTYNIYYSTRSGSYLHRFEVGAVTTSPVGNNLSANQRYFLVATAVDPNGMESDPSNEVSFVFDGMRNPAIAAFAPTVTPTAIAEETHSAAPAPIVTVEAPTPTTLSEEGPGANLLIAASIAVASGWFFRRKILAKSRF